MVDGEEAGTLTHPEEPMLMRHAVEKGGTDVGTAQTEATPRTRSEESG